jgi:ribosomal protein L11 methyltransferase
MAQKPLWRVSVQTSAESEEAVAELLGRVAGADPVSYTDVDTASAVVSVFLERKPGHPGQLRRQISEGLETVRKCGLVTGKVRISVARVKAQDWAESWKRHFQPIEIGSRLLVQASWHRRRPRKTQKLVVLDPGLSFGTGQHPTTAFCLRQLVRWRQAGTVQNVLDIGTGSGILAISAAALGFDRVDALDFDPESVRAARANARSNGLLRLVRIARQDLTRMPKRSSTKYSIICANLMADLLLSALPQIISRLNRPGILIIAGVLAREFPAVETAYLGAGLSYVSAKTDKDWRSGVFRRR